MMMMMMMMTDAEDVGAESKLSLMEGMFHWLYGQEMNLSRALDESILGIR